MAINDDLVSIAKGRVAKNFITRAVGLLFTTELAVDSGLFITKCNFIHTFFMRYSIDVVFVNKHLVVTKIVRDIRPWKMAFDKNATSVLELPAGRADFIGIGIGCQLLMRDIK